MIKKVFKKALIEVIEDIKEFPEAVIID